MDSTCISQVSSKEREQILRSQKDAILKKRKQQLRSSFMGSISTVNTSTNLLSEGNVVPIVKTFKICSSRPASSLSNVNHTQACEGNRPSERKYDAKITSTDEAKKHYFDDENESKVIKEQKLNGVPGSIHAKTKNDPPISLMNNGRKASFTKLNDKRISDSEINDNISFENSSGITDVDSNEDETDTRDGSPKIKLVSSISCTEVNWNDKEELKRIVMSPCPKDAGVVKCYIRRNKGKAKLFPEYRVYLKDGDIFLMTSKKRPKKQSSNYLISIGRNDFDKHSDNIVGKLRANFVGSEFQIFDNGTNPKHVDTFFDENMNKDPRSELGAILYSANLLGNRGPRKMQVCINKIGNDGKCTKKWQPVHKDEEMIQCFKQKSEPALRHLNMYENRQPKWNEDMGSYVLNFNDRVNLASVKNFQLIDLNRNNDNIVLQFGKASNDEFIMDVQWPMSLFQAFAICLSSFDSKLACD